MMRYEIQPEPGLDFILPLIALLTTELEMLQTMQQNETAAGALLQCSKPRWSSGLYNAFPEPLAGFKGRRIEWRYFRLHQIQVGEKCALAAGASRSGATCYTKTAARNVYYVGDI